MLKEILSITGKPGLFKLVSQGKNMLIVESLVDGNRVPAFAKDKAVSLGDIAIFTDTEEVPLSEVLEKVKAKENGAKCAIDPKSDNDALRKYMGEVLPNFDRDRVYPSDIRKLINWYNLLISSGMTDFVTKEEEVKTEENTEGKEEVKEKKKTAATATAKKAPANKSVKTSQSKAAGATRTNRSNRGV